MENAIESSTRVAGSFANEEPRFDGADPGPERETLAWALHVTMEITDSGCGIEAEVLPQILSRFRPSGEANIVVWAWRGCTGL